MGQVFWQILANEAKLSRQEIVEEVRQMRDRIGRVSGDSTQLIRRDRDSR